MIRIIRGAVVGLVACALGFAGMSTASAATPVTPSAVQTTVASINITPSASGVILSGPLAGHTYAEVLAAVKNSPNVRVVQEQIPASQTIGSISPQSVSFGWYIYVTLSQSQVRALMASDLAGQLAVIGLVAGPVAFVIAAMVYAYFGSIGSDGLNQCARWQLDFDYAGNLKKSECA